MLRNVRAKNIYDRRVTNGIAKSTTTNTMTDTYHDYNITRTVWLALAQNIHMENARSLIGGLHIMQEKFVCYSNKLLRRVG